MVHLAIILILLLGGRVHAQVFEDDFSDGDFTTNPTWSGADSNFVIFNLEGNPLLRLNDNEAARSYLSTPSNGIVGYWEFFIRIDGSAPSGSNKAEVILVSDTPDLSGTFNGYGIRVGETGDDFIRLIRYDLGSEGTIVLSDTTVFGSNGDYRIKVTRDAIGNWSLEVGDGYNGELVNSGGTGFDDTYSSSSYLGVKVTYTSSRTVDYFFDFKIDEPVVIAEPVLVTGIEQLDDSQLSIQFSRDLNLGIIETEYFTLNGNTTPTSLSTTSQSSLLLGFPSPFLKGRNTLQISDIQSANNDATIKDTTLTFFNFGEFEVGDVLITEFLKDPPPGSGLPEYIELINRTEEAINLKDWQIGDNSSLASISDSIFILPPDTFLVITSNLEDLKTVFGNFLALDVSLPALNNTTDQIRIFEEDGNLVDSLEYESDWGGVDVALERKNLDVSSTFKVNWGDSPNVLGGTPGSKNEIEQDVFPPELTDFEILNDSTFQLIFNEQIKPGPAGNPDNYSIAIPTALTNQQSESGENDFVKATFFEPDTVLLEFKEPVYSGNFSNILFIENQEDVFGNVAEVIEQFYDLIATNEPEPGDLVINEIMYDPPQGFSEFVEINLHEYKVFNLKGWTISDNSGEDIVITEEDFFIANSGVSFDRGLAWNQHVVLVPDSTINELAERRIINPRFPTLNNSSDAIVLKDPNGVVIDSLTYFSSWGGRDRSLERRSPEFPSILRENWGDHPTENLASPAQLNVLSNDEDAPILVDFKLVSDRSIALIFSEQLQDSSATNPENFGLTNPLSASPILFRPVSVDFFSPDTIQLSFEDPFFEFNVLEIFNQTDFFGNRNDRILINFEYVITSTAQPGEVKITEFAYDAPEGFSEFVEIYNPTEKNFDLNGWTFNDNSGNRKTISNTQFFLKAGEYAILAPDSTLIETFSSRKLLDISGFPALNNSSDALVLRDAEGVLMDSLTYSSSWGGDEVSLERRSIDFPSIYQENWGDSPAFEGGTPGIANQIPKDTKPPFVIESRFISSREIQLIFDERLFGEEAVNPENYYVNNSFTASSVLAIGDTIEITFNVDFQDGDTIAMVLRNLEDLFGNVQNEQVIRLTFVEISQATRQNVVINEILYRRKDALSPEFVELFNPTTFNYDVSGWILSDAGSNVELPNNTIISAGEYLILTDREDFAESVSTGLYLSNFPNLNDNGDEIIIKNSEGFTIDSLFYESDWGYNDPGISIERKDPLAASFDASNWAASTSESGNSAGEISSVFEEDVTPPNILFSSINDSSLFIAFTEVVRITNETEILVQNSDINLSEIPRLTGSEITIALGSPTSKNSYFSNPAQLSIQNLSDFKGNVATSVSSLIAEPLKPGDIIINEILYNPLADNEDNLPDQTEYIELYNPTEHAISLEGIFLHDAPDEDDEIRTILPVSTEFKWLAPDSFMLIYSEDEAQSFNQSKLARYFELESVLESEVIHIDRSSLSLASSGDAIYLADSTGATIDSVFYDESWQNPNLFDTRGVSLERIDPNRFGNDATNWSSSTHPTGGTPLMQNSIFQEAGATPDANGVSFTPNPFSPDDDGFEDNLFINYNLDAPDYLLRVRIFDRYGREVRELVNNYQAGFEGSLIWDGLTDDRTRNRVGIYIVYFEAYDSASEKDRTFKETVVLARKF